MKVLIVAHTDDEHGQHLPGDVIDLPEGEAKAYVEKNWGIIERAESKSHEVETGESKLAHHETAMKPAPGKK